MSADLLLGSITVVDIELRRKMKETIRSLGIGVSPDERLLALRGIETIAVRLAHVGRVAQDFGTRLAVALVLHPALPSCPGHDFWRRDVTASSDLFSIVLKPGCEAHLDDTPSA